MLGNVLFLLHNNNFKSIIYKKKILLLCNDISYIISVYDNIYLSCFDLRILFDGYLFCIFSHCVLFIDVNIILVTKFPE